MTNDQHEGDKGIVYSKGFEWLNEKWQKEMILDSMLFTRFFKDWQTSPSLAYPIIFLIPFSLKYTMIRIKNITLQIASSIFPWIGTRLVNKFGSWRASFSVSKLLTKMSPWRATYVLNHQLHWFLLLRQGVYEINSVYKSVIYS